MIINYKYHENFLRTLQNHSKVAQKFSGPTAFNHIGNGYVEIRRVKNIYFSRSDMKYGSI